MLDSYPLGPCFSFGINQGNARLLRRPPRLGLPPASLELYVSSLERPFPVCGKGFQSPLLRQNSFNHRREQAMTRALIHSPCFCLVAGPYAVLTKDTMPQTYKRKRSWSRAVFSNLQRKGLEKRFEIQKYVTKPDRKQLAAMLGLTDAQVRPWGGGLSAKACLPSDSAFLLSRWKPGVLNFMRLLHLRWEREEGGGGGEPKEQPIPKDGCQQAAACLFWPTIQSK